MRIGEFSFFVIRGVFMKTIRNNTFETNSSSTHSLVIHNFEGSNFHIPKGVEDYNICDNESADGSLFVGETRKLRYLLGIIASQIKYEADRDYFGVSNWYAYWGEKSKEGWNLFGDKILNFPWIKWLNEVVKDKCDTTLYLYRRYTEFPYFAEGESYDMEQNEVYEMLGIDKKDMFNESVVKAAFENIIFNPNVIIEDIFEEY